MNMYVSEVAFKPLELLKKALIEKFFSPKEADAILKFFETNERYRFYLDEDPTITQAKVKLFLWSKRYRYNDIKSRLKDNNVSKLVLALEHFHNKLVKQQLDYYIICEDPKEVCTVGWYKSRGVVFVIGDKRINSKGEEITLNECGVERANNTSLDDDKVVTHFTPRSNEFVQMVHHGGVIEVLDENEEVIYSSRLTSETVFNLLKNHSDYTWRYKLEPVIEVGRIMSEIL